MAQEHPFFCEDCNIEYPSINAVRLHTLPGECRACKRTNVRAGILPCLHIVCITCIWKYHDEQIRSQQERLRLQAEQKHLRLLAERRARMVANSSAVVGRQGQAPLTIRRGPQTSTIGPSIQASVLGGGGLRAHPRSDNTGPYTRPRMAHQDRASTTATIFHDTLDEQVRQESANRSGGFMLPWSWFNLNK